MNFTEKKVTLDNGVRIILEPYDMVRSVCVGVWINSGVVFETKENNGVAHFVEHLLFKGTEKRSSFEISEAIDSVGGQFDAFSSKEFTCYFIKVRDEYWKLSLDLLSDMIKNSTFIESELEKERNVIIEEIKMYEDAPDEIIHDLFTSSLFNNYPIGYPILGSKEIIKTLPREKILDYYHKMYTGPNIIITISGKFDSESVIDFTKKCFGDIPVGDGEMIDMIKPVPSFNSIIKKKDIEQVHLIVGTDSDSETHEDRYKISLLSTILGGGMSSRLFQKIREERGLAYSVFSYVNRFRMSGLLAIYAGCAYNEAENVLELIINELNILKKNMVTENELSRIKEQVKGNIILSLESTNARMNRLGRSEIYFKKQISIDDIIKKIDEVKVEDIMEMAQKYFQKDKLALTAIGPFDDNKLAEKLRLF